MRAKRGWITRLLSITLVAMLALGIFATTSMTAKAWKVLDAIPKTTVMECSVWSRPNTSEQYRIKKIPAGYDVKIGPAVYQSELGDGKTFYRTIKGSYILCKAFGDNFRAFDNSKSITSYPEGEFIDFGDFGLIIWDNRKFGKYDYLLSKEPLEMYEKRFPGSSVFANWGCHLKGTECAGWFIYNDPDGKAMADFLKGRVCGGECGKNHNKYYF